jgi:ankyrin repeat protein
MKSHTTHRLFFMILFLSGATNLYGMKAFSALSGRIQAPPFLSSVTVTGRAVFKTAEDLVYECVEAKNTAALSHLLQDILGRGVLFSLPPLPYGLNFYRTLVDLRTPLYRAIELNFLDIASVLLSYGAHADQPGPSGNTPLFCAVTQFNYDAVALLLSHANPNIANAAGFTPLLALAETGNAGIERAICSRCPAGIVIDHDAVRLGIAQLLIARGADVNAQIRSGMSVINFLCRDITQIPVSLIVYLIEHGLDLNAPYSFGKTNYQALEELGIDAINAALSRQQPQVASAAVRVLPSAVSADAGADEVDVSTHDVVPAIPALTPQQVAAQRQAKKEAKAAARAAAASQKSGAHTVPVAAAAPAQKPLPASMVAGSDKAVGAKSLHAAPAHTLPAQASAATPPAAISGSSKKSKKVQPAREEDLDALARQFAELDAARPPVYQAAHGRPGKQFGRHAQGAPGGASATAVLSDTPSSKASAHAIAAPAPVTPITPPYDYSRASGVLSGDIPFTALADDEIIALPDAVARAAVFFSPQAAFFKSIFDGDNELVITLLDDDPELIRAITPQGDTALHMAASIADLTLCQLLCERGADVHAKNFLHETPIMKIFDSEPADAEVRATVVFKYLVSRGARCDVTNSCGMNLLHYAVSGEFCAMTEYLCRTLSEEVLKAVTLEAINFYTDNVAVVDQLHYSRPLNAFDFVLYKKKNKTIRYLFKLLVDRLGLCELIKPLIPDSGDFKGKTGAEILRIFEQYERCRSAASLDHLYQTACFCLNLQLQNKAKIEIVNPLYAAVIQRDTPRLRQLCAGDVRYIVNMAYKNKDYVSPLQIAVAQFDLAAAAILLKAGANANYQIPRNSESVGAATALHVVACGGEDDSKLTILAGKPKITAICTMIDLLIKNSADVNAMTTTALDPLICVVQTPRFTEDEKIAVIQHLATHRANLKVIYPGNHTILHSAATQLNKATGSAINLVRALGDIIGDDSVFYGQVYDGAPGLHGTAMGIAMQNKDWATALYLFEKGGIGAYLQDAASCERVMAQHDLVTDDRTIESFFACLATESSSACEPETGGAAAAIAMHGPIDWTVMFPPPVLDQGLASTTIPAADFDDYIVLIKQGLLEELDLGPADTFLSEIFHQNHERVSAMLASDKTLANASARNGTTALHLALLIGDLAICRELIAAGARIDASDSRGTVPLASAMNSFVTSEATLIAMTDMLVNAGAVIDVSRDWSGLTLLHAAVQRENCVLLDRLCNAAKGSVKSLMKAHCTKTGLLFASDGSIEECCREKTFSAPALAYRNLYTPVLEIFMRYDGCATLKDFLRLVEVDLLVETLRINVLERKWQLLLAAPTPAARREALEVLCRMLHSFQSVA